MFMTIENSNLISLFFTQIKAKRFVCIISCLLTISIVLGLFSIPIEVDAAYTGSATAAANSSLWDYSFVALGDFTDDPNSLSGEHTTGAIAVGGNFTATNQYSLPQTTLGLRKWALRTGQGNVTGGTFTDLRGNLVVSSSSVISAGTSINYEKTKDPNDDANATYGKVVTNPFTYDFSNVTADMNALATSIATYVASHGTTVSVVPSGWTEVTLTGTSTTVNIFNIDMSTRIDVLKIVAPAGSQVIINVTSSGAISSFPHNCIGTELSFRNPLQHSIHIYYGTCRILRVLHQIILP